MSDTASFHDSLIHVSTQQIAPRQRFVAPAGLGARGLPWRLFWRFSRWIKTRQGRLDLLALSDHQLKDIGLSRGDAYNDFYQRDE